MRLGISLSLDMPAASFNTAAVPGRVLEFDLQNPASFTESGGAITALVNLASGVAWNTARTVMPGYSATGFNSRPGAVFNGTNMGVSSAEAAVVAALSNNAPTTTFILASTSSTAGVAAFLGASAPTITRPFRLLFRNATKYSFQSIDDSGGASQLKESAAGVATTAPRLLEFVDSGSHIDLYTEGVQRINADYVGGTKSNTLVTLGMFATNNTNSSWLAGALGALLIYNHVLTADERLYVRTGLAQRWNITI